MCWWTFRSQQMGSRHIYIYIYIEIWVSFKGPFKGWVSYQESRVEYEARMKEEAAIRAMLCDNLRHWAGAVGALCGALRFINVILRRFPSAVNQRRVIGGSIASVGHYGPRVRCLVVL